MEKSRVRVVPAMQVHVDHIKDNLRLSDVNFVKRLIGGSAEDSVQYLYDNSKEVWCGLLDGEPYVLFGVKKMSLIGFTGCTWLAGTDRIKEVKLLTAKKSKEYLDKLKKKYDSLIGYIDAQDKTSLRWHRWLGYRIDGPSVIKGNEYYTAILGGC